MKQRLAVFGVFILGCAVILSGCSNPPATAVVTVAADTPAPAMATATDAPTSTPEPSPTPVPPIPCTIVFESDRDGNREIYSMNPDGSGQINLSKDRADDFNPVWSPDGSQIAFVSKRETPEEGIQNIFVVNADGSNLRQLTHHFYTDWPSWSNDGRRITYTDGIDILIMNADGSGEPIKLTNDAVKDTRPSWSPDGRKIAWSSGDDGQWNLFVMDADGSNQKQITDNGQVHGATWTIDGRLLTNWGWLDQEEFCHNCVVTADGSEIVDAGGKGTLVYFVPFVTTNGERVELAAVDNFEGNSEIYLLSEKLPDTLGIGIGIINLTNNPAEDVNADWPANCLSGIAVTSTAIETVEEEPESNPNDYVFGYASYDPNQFTREKNFQTACDELGIQCVYGDIGGLIEQGVDAIIQNSDNMTVKGLHDDILSARDAGIPVFLLDAESITHGAYSITIDHSKWAKTSLGWLLEKIDGSGEIAYFDLDPYNRYSDTINDLLLSYPDVSVVEFRDGKYDPIKIKPETSDFVYAHPELKAIWHSHDNNQAMWGLEENGVTYDQWPAMVCEANRDGLILWEKAQQKYPGFECFAVANPPGIAYDAVYAAYYLVTGHQIDDSALSGPYGQSLYVDIPEVTNENYKQLLSEMKKLNLYEVDKFMSPEEILEKWFID